MGLLLVLAWLILTILIPLKDDVVLAAGLTLHAGGLTGFLVALFNYVNTPVGQPVTSGIYRVSRHP